VPFDETKWTSHPLVLREDNGRWYGLGTSDMKGFFPVLVEAVRGISLTALKKPLYVVATADEESSMSGIRALYESGMPKARYSIVGEPTSLKPVHMNKGIAMEAVRLTGVPGHSSNPARGRNAIDGMYNVMQALMQWRNGLKGRYPAPDFEVAWPTVNFGRIFGGDSPNRICPSCELHFDIRLVPGMDIDQTRAELRFSVHEAIDGMGFTAEIFHLFPGVPPMHTPVDSPLVSLAEQITGEKAMAVQFATEGYFYNALGMDTIILGPGDINTVHQPDEYLNSAMIKPAVNVYRSLIQALCIHEN
jgi:acetylornithine deacetylase